MAVVITAGCETNLIEVKQYLIGWDGKRKFAINSHELTIKKESCLQTFVSLTSAAI